MAQTEEELDELISQLVEFSYDGLIDLKNAIIYEINLRDEEKDA